MSLGAQARPSRAPSWRRRPACGRGRRSRRRPAPGRRSSASASLPLRLGPLVGGEHERAAAVVDAGRVAGRVRAVLADRPGSLASASSVVSRRGPSSTSTTVSPFRPLTVTGTISSGRRPSSVAAIARSCERSAQRSMSARVISSSSPTSVASSNICLPRERVGEAVVDHRVERLGVAHAEAEARLRQQVGRLATSTPCRRRRRPRRRRRGSRWSSIPAARMPEAHTLLIVSEETSFGMPALICAWRDGIWPWPAWSTWPMTTCWTCSGADVGALERGRDRGAAELGGVERGEAAAELADRRAGGAEDHGLGHRCVSWLVREGLSVAPVSLPPDGGPRHHRRAAPTRRRHRRRRASSRARASPTTSRTARSRRCVDVRRGQARGHASSPSPTPTAGAGCSWASAQRDELRRRARPRGRRGGRRARARELGTRDAVLGAAPPRRRRVRRRRSSRARCSRPTASTATRATRTTTSRTPRARSWSAPTTTSPTPVDRAARGRRGGQRRPRPPEHARQRA